MIMRSENHTQTLDNVKKCYKNAIRLFDDSKIKGISLPTSAVLIEIAIEEVGKGIIWLANLPEHLYENINNGLLKQGISVDSIKYIQKISEKVDINNFNVTKHDKKLQIIQEVFGILKLEIPDMIQSLKDPLIKFSGDPPDTIEKSLQEAWMNINSIDVTKWNKIKEKGLYVGCSNHKQVAPCEQNIAVFHMKQLNIIFGTMIYILGSSIWPEDEIQKDIDHINALLLIE